MNIEATKKTNFKSLTQCLAVIAVLLLWSGASVRAQSGGSSVTDGSTPLGLTPGGPAGSFALSGFENVNPFNGGLNFSLPLLQIGGRGGAQHTIPLKLEQKWRTIKVSQTIGSPVYYPDPNGWQGVLPGYSPGVMLGRLTGIATLQSCPESLPSLTRLTFTAGDGTEYEFRDVKYDGQPKENFYQFDVNTNTCSNFPVTTNRGRVFVTTDGSMMTFISDEDILDFYGVEQTQVTSISGYMFTKDGTRYRIEGSRVRWIADRNGNRITFEYGTNGVNKITDSLGRVVTINYWADQGFGQSYDEITYYGFGGAPRSIKINNAHMGQRLRTTHATDPTAPYTYQQLFPEVTWSSPGTAYNPNHVISSVVLPDGRSYQFYYNVYGELARVVLPTGGAIEYDWEGGLNGGNASGVIINSQIYRRVVERRVYKDGSGNNGGTLEGKTQFSKPEDSMGTVTGPVIVTQRAADDTWMAKSFHTYYGSAYASFPHFWTEPTSYNPWKDGKETQTETQESNGVTTQRVENDWAQRTNVAWFSSDPANLLAPSKDPRISETRNTWVTTSQTAKQQFTYDQYNNQIEVKEFDFGASTYTRRTTTSYLTNQITGYNYDTVNDSSGAPITTNPPDPTKTIHLRSLPLTQLVFGASGNEKAKTTYEYDNYNQTNPDVFHAALTTRSNITGHASISTPPYNPPVSHSTSYFPRGNVTQISKWLDAGTAQATALSTRLQYDIAGNVVKTVDPRSTISPLNIIATTFDFTDRFGAPDTEAQSNTLPINGELAGGLMTYAFATKVTNAAPFNHTAYTQLDYYLGKPVNGEDANGVVTSGAYNDLLDRATQLVVAINQTAVKRQTTFDYNDAAKTITTTSDQIGYGDNLFKSQVLYDGLGRTIESRQYEDATNFIKSTQEYDGMGRINKAFNVTRTASEDTYGRTETTYDGLSRVKIVETKDKNGASTGIVQTAYLGNATTVTDQASKKRRSVTDGLGRLIRVDEPDANGNLEVAGSPVQPTNYTYDVLDDLARVQQGSQNRYFLYDSLKRLIRSVNPEQGVNAAIALSDPLTLNSQWNTKYSYDNNSNLTQKIDARNITTNYVYDELDRVTQRSYVSDPQSTPTVTYRYEKDANNTPITFAKGRLTAVINSVSKTEYTVFDALGRITESKQTTNVSGTNYPYIIGYEYNLAGEMKKETYPSGRAITTTFDTAGRISGVSGLKSSVTTIYASQLVYTPHRAVASMKIGNDLSNPRFEHTNFNSRLQPTQIGLGNTATSTSLLALDYTYNGTEADNNGNVRSQTITAPGGAIVQTYSYDSLNRLEWVKESVSNKLKWQQSYSYDRFGNRTGLTNTGTEAGWLPTQSTPAIDPANNNRLANAVYDAAGNVTQTPAPTQTMEYDAENHQTSSTDGSSYRYHYGYDGDGRRVQKINDDGGPEIIVMVYNIMGHMIAEYSSLAPAPNPKTAYLTADHLGSTRVITEANGSVRVRRDYLPFGEELPVTVGKRSLITGYGGLDNTRQKFTGHERDSESGLDFMQARYCASVMGRFMSVDPENAGSSMEDAQSWNGYAYARNNPQLYRDPDGRRYLIRGPNGYGFVTDEVFFKERQLYLERPFPGPDDNPITFTGNGGFMEQGEILGSNGEWLASYAQISIDNPAARLAYEMQKVFNDPNTYKRAAIKTLIGLAIGAAVSRGTRFSPEDRLSRAAGVPDRGGFTKAGRSLTKHGVGKRIGNSKFPSPKGNPSQINQQAQDIIDDILTTPGTTVINSYRPRFGNTIEYTAPDGRGLVYKANGEFLFFKE